MKVSTDGDFWVFDNKIRSHKSNSLISKLAQEIIDLKLELSVFVKATDEPNLSTCCGAPIYEDTDICADCKEHV